VLQRVAACSLYVICREEQKEKDLESVLMKLTGMLLRGAVWCSVLQCVAVCCSVFSVYYM